VRWAILALAALALSGCESSQEKSAKLERAAKLAAASAAPSGPASASAVIHPSRKVKVGQVSILRGTEGLAAVVTLRNTSSTPLRDVPLVLTVRNGGGASIYSNSAPEQAPGLGSASLIGAHSELTWIDDQIQGSGQGLKGTVKAGEAPAVDGPVPQITIAGAHLIEDPSSGPGAEGSVVNHSSVSQSELVVYAVVRSSGRIVAAGRAVLADAPAGASTRFQLFFIGDPRGGRLEVLAPPSTLG
jgi:hypothetical protein